VPLPGFSNLTQYSGRGDDTIELFNWMEDLREQASAVNGIVLTILGNHEYMNAIGTSEFHIMERMSDAILQQVIGGKHRISWNTCCH